MLGSGARTVVVAWALGACSGDKGGDDTGATQETGTMTMETGTMDTMDTMGDPGPGAFAANWQTSPDFFTAMAGPVDGGSVHRTVQIWYSTNIRGEVEGNATMFTAPEGTVAIKTTDDGAGNTAVVTMIKQPGSDPANGDWFYEVRGGAAPYDVMDSGALQGCIDCHASYAATDYLGGTGLR
jgi:hypothetical protein